MRTYFALLVLSSMGVISSLVSAAETPVDFAHQIVPILRAHCSECHTGNQKEGGLSLNTRESMSVGGESGKPLIAADPNSSELVARIITADQELRMPPEGQGLSEIETNLIKQWMREGANWEPGFSFAPDIYEPPLRPRRPSLPAVTSRRENPIDRILDSAVLEAGRKLPADAGDEAFLRRVTLDLIGLLPTPDERATFLSDRSSDKRERWVQTLLTRDIDYAEHWLSLWNDLLRNDYAGTGFITQGRTQISAWLYDALATNMPYDQIAKELIAPASAESSGFANGIRWRGEVSAGQTVEIQFAQSIGQAFLGVNLKCASCHDSFIDRWTLDDAYGLAAVYSERPLELHRCDKPTGKMAKPAWLFGELGQVDPSASKADRLKQLAALMTHRENGRFTRTIVNRLWHRLMGRGIVHPTDAMQTEPWNEDLLDYLAEHLVDHHYDLKQTLALIATSKAYQSRCELVSAPSEANGYQYAGVRAKRMTAEQFIDCTWQLTESAPKLYDAPLVRGKPSSDASSIEITGQWIWSTADAMNVPAGKSIVLRKQFIVSKGDGTMVAVISCDNSFVLFVNGKQVAAGENWEAPETVVVTNLKPGNNELTIVANNGGDSPNPAGLFFEGRWSNEAGEAQVLVSDESWVTSETTPDKKGKFKTEPTDWKPASSVSGQSIWAKRVGPRLLQSLARAQSTGNKMIRSSLLKSDFLSRSLGRPNRDQIVSVRPQELTTLEAINLSNGEDLAMIIRSGSENLSKRQWASRDAFVDWLYEFALSRQPNDFEQRAIADATGDQWNASVIEDLLWSVVMLPEFQFVR